MKKWGADWVSLSHEALSRCWRVTHIRPSSLWSPCPALSELKSPVSSALQGQGQPRCAVSDTGYGSARDQFGGSSSSPGRGSWE